MADTLPSRFDNLTVEQMLDRADELEREEREIQEAIKIKLIAACTLKAGKVYRVRRDLAHPHQRGRLSPYAGRRFYVDRFDFWASKTGNVGVILAGGRHTGWTYILRASGVLERPGKKSADCGMFGGRFNYNFNSFNVEHLDPTTEEPPPDA